MGHIARTEGVKKRFRSGCVIPFDDLREVYEDVNVEVTAYNNDRESTTTFGIACDQGEVVNSADVSFDDCLLTSPPE